MNKLLAPASLQAKPETAPAEKKNGGKAEARGAAAR
jgi:hypothetical protein